MEWIDQRTKFCNFLCRNKKKEKEKNMQLLNPYVIIIYHKEWRCCEKEKNNRWIIFYWYACTQSNSLIFSSSSSSPVLFISYKLFGTWHFHRQTIVSESWNGSVDRKSPWVGGVGGCVVRSYIHESRMRSSERKPIIRVRTNLIYNYGYESLRRSRVRRWKIIIIKAAISCVRTIVYTCLLKVSLTIRDPLAQ